MSDAATLNQRVLLTWDGKVLARHHDPMALRAVELAAEAEPILVDLPPPPRFSDTFIYDDNDPAPIECTIGDMGPVIFRYSDQHLAWHAISTDGLYLCREHYSEAVGFTRDSASEWESFLALDLEAFKALRHFLREEWVYRGGSAGPVPHRAHFVAPFTIRLGDLNIDLRLQAVGEFGRSRIAVNHDGWKSTDLYRYRPLVYVTAYSSPPVLEQMRLCITSMREFGGFDGPIVVMTDLTEQEIRRLFAEADEEPGDIVVLNLPARDFIGFVCSKYSIVDHAAFEGFQPILYLDPDIIIDRPIEPMLVGIARSGRICAPAEGWNQVHHHIPVGASLMRMDEIECRFLPGLNGGTIGFPALDVPGVREVIEKIRRTIACTGRHFGRKFNGWADQEVMNYIAIKTDTFDSVTITPFLVHYQAEPEILGGPRGMVHFWGRSSSAKVEDMAKYADSVRSQTQRPHRESMTLNNSVILPSTVDLSQSRPAIAGLLLPNDQAAKSEEY